MSGVEAPPLIRIEGLGGSFSRNVKMGEHGLGMVYANPGDVFHLRAVWEDSQGAKTELASGTFEYIYFRDISDDEEILNRISSTGDWDQIISGKDGQLEIGFASVEDLLCEEGSDDLVIGLPELGKSTVNEVVLKKWGYFVNQNQIYSSKMKQLNDIDVEIPINTIEDDFNSLLHKVQKRQSI